MRLHDVKDHWRRSAKTFKGALRATTKTSTIKDLEIDALSRAIRKSGCVSRGGKVLEVGCGNGYNLTGLSKHFPKVSFTGIDYAPEMIENAKKINKASSATRINYQVGDVLRLDKALPLYDVVFTDRCLINLNSSRLQLDAFDQLIGKVRSGGCLILIENPRENYERLSACRKVVDLPPKPIPAHNVLISEKKFLAHAASRSMKLEVVDDFAALHDLVLYVLTPLSNKGEASYDHPLVRAIADFTLKAGNGKITPPGAIGQNRLYLFRKK